MSLWYISDVLSAINGRITHSHLGSSVRGARVLKVPHGPLSHKPIFPLSAKEYICQRKLSIKYAHRAHMYRVCGGAAWEAGGLGSARQPSPGLPHLSPPLPSRPPPGPRTTWHLPPSPPISHLPPPYTNPPFSPQFRQINTIPVDYPYIPIFSYKSFFACVHAPDRKAWPGSWEARLSRVACLLMNIRANPPAPGRAQVKQIAHISWWAGWKHARQVCWCKQWERESLSAVCDTLLPRMAERLMFGVKDATTTRNHNDCMHAASQLMQLWCLMLSKTFLMQYFTSKMARDKHLYHVMLQISKFHAICRID